MSIALSPKEYKSDVINNAIRELQQGRDNASGVVTLAVSAATTTVVAVTCAPSSKVFLHPNTLDAAAEVATGHMYVSSKTYGSFVITHTNNAVADRTFDWTIRGGN